MEELKERIRRSGITRKVICEKIGLHYMTLSNYLNKFLTMPDHIRKAIEDVLKEGEK